MLFQNKIMFVKCNGLEKKSEFSPVLGQIIKIKMNLGSDYPYSAVVSGSINCQLIWSYQGGFSQSFFS